MAKEQWKKLGVFVALVSLTVTLLGGLIGLAWAGSGKLTAFDSAIKTNHEKASDGIKSVGDNQKEDRKTIEKLAGIVSAMKTGHDDDYKELKQDANDAKLRDERQATQYATILSHMQQQTTIGRDNGNAIGDLGKGVNDLKVDLGKAQTKIETLIKD